MARPGPDRLARPPSASWFRWALVAAAVLGLAVRLAFILLERRDHEFGGDAGFYHLGANLLADGHGFVSPYFFPAHRVQAADHPPLYLVYLSLPSLVGLRSVTSHLVWSAVLGTGTVVVVGLTGREIAGPRLGVIAAGLAAVTPNLWIPDGSLMAESMAMFATACALWFAYRYWWDPRVRWLVGVGVASGAGALSRSELILFVPFLVVPLVLLAPGPTRRARWQGLAAAAAAAALVLAPWIVFNLTRFERPELLSTQFGLLLTSANCDRVWDGPDPSYFLQSCSIDVERTLDIEPWGDQSVQGAAHREVALDYVGDHLDEYPRILAVRAAAILGLYHRERQILIDGTIEGRGIGVARAGMWVFQILAIVGVAGAVLLRRSRAAPVFPLLVPPVTVLVTVLVTYASTRFRAAAEVSVVLLAAIAVEMLLRMRTRERPPPVRPDGVEP
jgi:hypothetical protein